MSHVRTVQIGKKTSTKGSCSSRCVIITNKQYVSCFSTMIELLLTSVLLLRHRTLPLLLVADGSIQKFISDILKMGLVTRLILSKN